MKLSAQHFRDPLLCVLATLSDHEAGTPVPMKDTYRPVMDAMGIANETDHGMNDATKTPMVLKWIQWAFLGARKANLGVSKGRGKWALTEAGLLHVAKVTGVTIAPKAPATAHVMASATVVAITKTQGVSVNHGSTNDESLYHEDAYIRALGIGRTPCFGSYSDHASAVCTKCPLAGACRNALSASLAALSMTLRGEDLARSMPAKPKADTPAATPAPTAPTAVDTTGIDWTKADEILSRIEASCASCGSVIKEKEKCYWVESVGDDDIDDEGALFHLSCGGK